MQNKLLFHPDFLLNEKYTQIDSHTCMASSCPLWAFNFSCLRSAAWFGHMTQPAHI